MLNCDKLLKIIKSVITYEKSKIKPSKPSFNIHKNQNPLKIN